MKEPNRSPSLRGIGVSPGVCLGAAMRYENEELTVVMERTEDTEAQQRLITETWKRTEAELRRSYEIASARAQSEADVFFAHIMLLTDEASLISPIRAMVAKEKCSAPWAVRSQFKRIIKKMISGTNEYLQERVSDMKDLEEQILRCMLGKPKTNLGSLSSDVILIARDLTPSDTIRMDLKHIKGVVCEEGGVTSHTALLARAMGIPAVMGCAGILDAAVDGQTLLLDGETGIVCFSPEARDIEYMDRRHREEETERIELERFRGRRTLTGDGRRMRIYANIARPEECVRAVQGDCEGVGLFRSEFLYLDRDTLPSEEEQYQAYSAALQSLGGRSVTIRTLDVGGDKELPLLERRKEANPFLGHRAIRLCLDERELFLTQLRALYRASVHGELKIMFPMIATLEELREAKDCAAEAMRQLTQKGVPYRGDVPLGMMVEIPSAAVMADHFAKEADFFSIGTNDLIQYTMAADRGNPKVVGLYTPFQPAVLRLLRITIIAAQRFGIECCLCGGAAEDGDFLPVLAGMGLDSISVSPPNILRLRKMLSEISADEIALAQKTVFGAKTVDEVRLK